MLKLWGYCAIVLGGLLVSPISPLSASVPVTLSRPSALPSPVVVAERQAVLGAAKLAAAKLAAVGIEEAEAPGFLSLATMAHWLLSLFALSKFLLILVAGMVVGVRRLIRRRS